MDWLRSITVLGIAFVAVVATTLGLAGWLVPQRATATASDAASPGASRVAAQPTPPNDGIPGLGGVLTVSGDHSGFLVLSRESQESQYALVGGDGRVTFEGAPVIVTQLSYDGWEFFPEPDECSVTPGDLDDVIGIGFAELVCTDLAEIRDKGVVSFAGTIGLPVDRLAGRTLPLTGGTLSVGAETWTFDFAYLVLWQQPMIGGDVGANMELFDEPLGSSLLFAWDVETHRISLVAATRNGERADAPQGACTFERTELGKPNPGATTVELTIDCPAVEVPSVGVVPISGTVVVDELEIPDLAP